LKEFRNEEIKIGNRERVNVSMEINEKYAKGKMKRDWTDV